jgi:hypothetical protein
METTQPPNTTKATISHFRRNDFIGSYSGDEKNRSPVKFAFNFNKDISNNAETEITLTIRGSHATVTAVQREKSVDSNTDDAVIKMLESWVEEEETEEGEKSLQELMKGLDKNSISFVEIT